MEVDSNHRSNLQQIYSLSPLATRESIHMELCSIKPMIGLEPITCWLQISCSANWATSAYTQQPICNQLLCLQLTRSSSIVENWATSAYFSSDSDGNRTRVTAVKGRCLNRLTMEPKKKKTPRVGLEPTTTRLTAECSTIELSRKMSLRSKTI